MRLDPWTPGGRTALGAPVPFECPASAVGAGRSPAGTYQALDAETSAYPSPLCTGPGPPLLPTDGKVAAEIQADDNVDVGGGGGPGGIYRRVISPMALADDNAVV